MQLSQIPLRMQKVWGTSAGGAYIRTVPVASQIGISDGAASFTDGFVPDNFAPVAGGGVPPFGQDMNGALNVITGWEQWLQAGGPVGYDAAFASAIGGYPVGAILDSTVTPGVQYFSTSDNNATNPDDPLTSTNWSRVGLPAGTPVPLLATAPPPGYIVANAATVGSTASNSNNPSDKYLFVFFAIWNQFPNTVCPIFDSAGNPSTRGANAVADFLANKRLQTPDMRGLGFIGCDTMGGSATTFFSGVPVTIGSATIPGSILGENLHTLVSGEVPAVAFSGVTATESAAHNHNYNNPVDSGARVSGSGNLVLLATSTTTTGNENQSHAHAFSGNIGGGGGAHNTVERNMTVYWGLKT